MEPNKSQMNSMTIARKLALKGRQLLRNGVAERKNRTILQVARAMLYDQGLPKFLWGVAANTVVYVQNRCPLQALDSKTPR